MYRVLLYCSVPRQPGPPQQSTPTAGRVPFPVEGPSGLRFFCCVRRNLPVAQTESKTTQVRREGSRGSSVQVCIIFLGVSTSSFVSTDVSHPPFLSRHRTETAVTPPPPPPSLPPYSLLFTSSPFTLLPTPPLPVPVTLVKTTDTSKEDHLEVEVALERKETLRDTSIISLRLSPDPCFKSL